MSATDPTGDQPMPGPTRNPAVEDLAPLAGRWRIEARFPTDPPVTGAGEVSFEWIEERAFLVQRWRSDEPAAPDGIAVLGFDEAARGARPPPAGRPCSAWAGGRGVRAARCSCSAGSPRLYRTSLDDGLWRVWRE